MTEAFQRPLWTPFGYWDLGLSPDAAWAWATILGILLIALPLMLAVAMIIYADRKIWAAMALRRGPNVVGPFGLLQSFADGLKVFLQETIIPSAANRGLFIIAPIITFTVALMAWAVIPFDDEAQALRIANDTEYGLAAGVWTANLARAHRMARGLRAGSVWVNYWDGGDMTAPFGGYKQSGNGRDKSLHAFDKYTEMKATWINLGE